VPPRSRLCCSGSLPEYKHTLADPELDHIVQPG
jgi:hypothetical protein